MNWKMSTKEVENINKEEDNNNELDTTNIPSKKVYLTSRCGVDQFCDLIGNFCDVKKKVIEDMGFGELLKLKEHKLRMQLLEDLMMRFDVSTGELSVHGHNLAINIDDVVTILGVNVDGDDVESQMEDDDETT